MQVFPVSNNTNFKALRVNLDENEHFYKIYKNERSSLEKLGKEYDISLSSHWETWDRTSNFKDGCYIGKCLQVSVSNLNENPVKKVFRSLFSDKGSAYVPETKLKSITNIVEACIIELNTKTLSLKK